MAECMPCSPRTGACHGAWLLSHWHRPGLLGTARSRCRHSRSRSKQACMHAREARMETKNPWLTCSGRTQTGSPCCGWVSGTEGSSQQGQPAWHTGHLSVAHRLLNGSGTSAMAAIGSSTEQQRRQVAAAAEWRSGVRKPGAHSLMSGPPSSSSLKVSGSSSDSSLSSLCTQQTEQRHHGTVSSAEHGSCCHVEDGWGWEAGTDRGKVQLRPLSHGSKHLLQSLCLKTERTGHQPRTAPPHALCRKCNSAATAATATPAACPEWHFFTRFHALLPSSHDQST